MEPFLAGGANVRERLFRLALLSTTLYCVVGAAINTIAAARALPAHHENTYTESPTVYAATQAIHTGRLYYAIHSPPYVPQTFGPLFYAYNAALAWVARGEILETFHLARTWTFVSFLLCAVAIERICRKLGFPGWHAQLAGLLFLSLPVFYGWNASVRPDFPCLLLTLLSLLYALEGLRAPVTRVAAYVPSGLLAGAAFLIKQPGAAVAIAIGVVLLREHKHRQAIGLALGAAAPVLAALLVLLWRREPFWEQITAAGQGIFSLRDGALWTARMLRDPNKIVPLAIGCVGFPAALRGGEGPRLVAAFTAVNLAAALATIPALAGNYNYFFPAFAGCALLLPFAMQAIARSGKTLQVAACVATLVGLPLALAANVDSHWKAALRGPWTQAELPAEALQQFQILSDEPNFNLLGRDPEYLDPYLLHVLELTGRWDARPLVEDVSAGRFDLVVLAGGAPGLVVHRGITRFGAEVVSALNAEYERVCEAQPRRGAAGAMVLEPRGRRAAIGTEALSRTLGRECVADEPGRAPGVFITADSR